MNIDEKYMFRAIQLGKNALGTSAPNPMVGCVIVHGDKILGEGFTSPYGGNHAEVNAIRSVVDKTHLQKATLYVTLEPCAHFGNTPPCADLIIFHNIKKVVIGIGDPHNKVAGKGIQRLRKAGIDVVEGVLEKQCREHHKRFLAFHEKKRPYIILKWAMTHDGFLAPKAKKRTAKPKPYWITTTKSRQLVHKWRSDEMAILVGTRTVLEDNPRLDVRHWSGQSPIRVVLDRNLRIPKDFYVMDGSQKTIILTEKKVVNKDENTIFKTLDFKRPLAAQICQMLHGLHINSLIVEGGATTLQTFIDETLWDEARIFKGNTLFGDGLAAPMPHGQIVSKKGIFEDNLTVLQNDSQYHL